MPEVADLDIPGFSRYRHHGLKTFTLSTETTAALFDRFGQSLECAIGRRYLPVLRMSDGEYLFNLGFQPPSPRVGRYAVHYMRYLAARFRPRRLLVAGGSHGGKPLYGSASYSKSEVEAIRRKYVAVCRRVAETGFLALDLSYCEVPFQENYFPALRGWLARNAINLSKSNYVPFYFVYAVLTGPERRRILSGRRILVIHSATGKKQDAIRAGLSREGAADVLWHVISGTRSFFDVVPVEQFVGRVDLCVFGAGIGKAAILAQLEPLGVPCIDAGYVMEVWADPSVAASRIFTQPDEPLAQTTGADSQR